MYWSAFSFTLFSFTALYFVTKKQFVKEQNKFVAKFGSLNTRKLDLQNHKELIKKF
jgi:heme exporter protein D